MLVPHCSFPPYHSILPLLIQTILSFQVTRPGTHPILCIRPSYRPTPTASSTRTLPARACTSASSATRAFAAAGITCRLTSRATTSVRTARRSTHVSTRSSSMQSAFTVWASPATYMASSRSCWSRRTPRTRRLARQTTACKLCRLPSCVGNDQRIVRKIILRERNVILTRFATLRDKLLHTVGRWPTGDLLHGNRYYYFLLLVIGLWYDSDGNCRMDSDFSTKI